MSKMRDEAVRRLRDELAGDEVVRLAVLFGSVASGEAGPESDVDLAILGDAPLSVADRTRIVDRVARALGRPVDLVDLHSVGQPLLGSIVAGGVRLVGDAEAWGDLIVRNLATRTDFLPYRERILAERRRAWLGD